MTDLKIHEFLKTIGFPTELVKKIHFTEQEIVCDLTEHSEKLLHSYLDACASYFKIQTIKTHDKQRRLAYMINIPAKGSVGIVTYVIKDKATPKLCFYNNKFASAIEKFNELQF